MQVEDWLDDLVHFGPDIVAEACARWRIGQNRRPTPHDVIAIAITLQREADEKRELESPQGRRFRSAIIADRRLRHDAIERRNREDQLAGRAIVNQWARAKGHADLDAYCAATGELWVDVYTRIVQEICAAAAFPPHLSPRWRSLADLIGGGLPWTGKRKPQRETLTAADLGVEAVEVGVERPNAV